VYSDSGFPASRQTLQKGLAGAVVVVLAVFLDDDI